MLLYIFSLNKNYIMKYNILLLIILSLSNLNAQESNKKSTDTIQKLDQVFINTKVIFGSKYVAQNRSGSAYYVSAEELEKFSCVYIY